LRHGFPNKDVGTQITRKPCPNEVHILPQRL
jgi:hypothetical protein